jgi:hypothetical protein
MPNTYKLFSTIYGVAVAENDDVIMVGQGGFRAANADTVIANIAGREISIPCRDVSIVNAEAPGTPTSAAVLAIVAAGLEILV